MSGGVDSSVATALAVEAGHDVVGVHLNLAHPLLADGPIQRGCGSAQDTEDAAKVAEMLGIPYEVWDLAEEFEAKVIADFVEQYRAGNTPNPCVRCNDLVKTRELLMRSQALGFDAVCTGHYARLERAADGSAELHRAFDENKDQSYILAVIGPADLRRLMFPLGRAKSKAWVRQQAAERGFPVSNKPDSYDICFIPDGDTQGFLRRRLGEQGGGEIVDTEGNVVGEHSGYYQFTVGQRKGLHLGRPSASGKPRYVLETRPATNQVVVGEAELLSIRKIRARRAVWLVDSDEFSWDPAQSAQFGDRVECALNQIPDQVLTAQVRAHGTPAIVKSLAFGAGLGGPAAGTGAGAGAGDVVEVEVATPIRGIARGQSLVLYRGTQAVCEAVIDETE